MGVEVGLVEWGPFCLCVFVREWLPWVRFVLAY